MIKLIKQTAMDKLKKLNGDVTEINVPAMEIVEQVNQKCQRRWKRY